MTLDYNTAWDKIEDNKLAGDCVKYRSSKHKTGRLYLYSEPCYKPRHRYALVILKTPHHVYAIWVSSSRKVVDTRILQNTLIALLDLPYGQVNVFNNLRVDRRTRYHICTGCRALYFTDLEVGRFSQKQIVIPKKHEAFLTRFHRQAKDFIIQQTY